MCTSSRAPSSLCPPRVENLTDHLLEVLTHPDSSVPIPYTELLWSERPGYYRQVGPTEHVRGKHSIKLKLLSWAWLMNLASSSRC